MTEFTCVPFQNTCGVQRQAHPSRWNDVWECKYRFCVSSFNCVPVIGIMQHYFWGSTPSCRGGAQLKKVREPLHYAIRASLRNVTTFHFENLCFTFSKLLFLWKEKAVPCVSNHCHTCLPSESNRQKYRQKRCCSARDRPECYLRTEHFRRDFFRRKPGSFSALSSFFLAHRSFPVIKTSSVSMVGLRLRCLNLVITPND